MDKEWNKRVKVIEKELRIVEKQEKKLRKAALSAKPAPVKMALESKIPEKVYNGLESAFTKGFSIVFQQGTALIEKSYKKEEIQNNHSIRDYAVQLKGGRKELRQMHRSAKRSDSLNMAATTAEGLVLGVLGIGMPDIVLFLTTLLRGVYETALNYGCDYGSQSERYLILKMMAASLTYGEGWVEANEAVDGLMEEENLAVTEEALNAQMRQTAAVFAMDMLLIKFIQGLPIVGIIGGAANPIYYNRVMHYVQLKYRKRYLQKQYKSFQL